MMGRVLLALWACGLTAQAQVVLAPAAESRVTAPLVFRAVTGSYTLAPSLAAPSLIPSLAAPKLPRVEAARKLLVADKKRLSPADFAAYVEGEPSRVEKKLALAEREPPRVKEALRRMYGSLSELVAAGRSEDASAVAARFVDYLEALGARDAVAPWARALADRSRGRLADGTLIDALVLQERTRSQLAVLKKELRPYRGSVKTRVGGIKVPDVLPEERRIHGGSDRKVRVATLGAIADEISFHRKNLTATPLPQYIKALVSRVRELKHRIDRFEETLFPRSFVAGRKHAIIGVPANENLRLTPEPGGFHLTATFKTDINDQRVLEFFQRSIEDYWRGSFDFQGASHRWRTTVVLEPLAPGEDFPEGSLRLVAKNGPGVSTTRNGVQIRLGRNPRYGTPAHEFGHVLGLADEYSDVYEFEAGREVQITVPGSLMGASETGIVLPHHFRLAYQLLRRRSR